MKPIDPSARASRPEFRRVCGVVTPRESPDGEMRSTVTSAVTGIGQTRRMAEWRNTQSAGIAPEGHRIAWLRCLASVLLLALGLATAAPAQTRVDLFDKRSNRTGSATIDERTGRIDFYDTKSNRTGYGRIDRSTGRIDLYNLDGSRRGSGTLAPSGGSIRGRR